MTDAENLYLELADLGVRLSAEAGRLIAEPATKLDPALCGRIRASKDALLALMATDEPEYVALVAWFETITMPPGPLVLAPGVTMMERVEVTDAYYRARISRGEAKHETIWFLRRLREAMTRG